MFETFAALGALLSVNATAIPKGPAEAIAIADAHPGRGTSGTYRMTVAAGGRTLTAIFLNSSTDYRAPDDLTIQLSPMTAKALSKRLGAPPEVALIGRTITVRGSVRAVPIANMLAGRPRSGNRYQHTVFVQDENQITVD